jgi:hypothetical protein
LSDINDTQSAEFSYDCNGNDCNKYESWNVTKVDNDGTPTD